MASLSALSSRVAHQARFGSKAHRRVTAGRGVRASALPQKGRPALTMVMRVPSAKESEVDALFASHEAMMHDTHVIGEAEADDIGHPRMLEYYVAKSTELSDPLDAASSPTGNLLYAVTERYVDALGVKEHMKIGAERWSGFPELAELIRDFGCFAQPNGVQLTTLKDTAEACKTRKGDVTLSLGIVVPASKERELDALFALHEAFMRDTHACAGDVANPLHDDGKTPRLTHFSVNKAFELVDPFDETKGFTGAVQYSIAETYVNANGVEGHFSFKERYPEVFEGVVKNFTHPEYARFADVGGGRVIAAQSSKNDDFASNIIGGVKKALDELLPRRAPHEEFCEDYCPEEW